MASDVSLAGRQLIIALPDLGGQVLLQHGLTQREGAQEMCFVVDADFYSTERTEVTDV